MVTSRAPENLKIGWERAKTGCHVRFLELWGKKHIFVVIPDTVVFMHLFWAFRPIWMATSISHFGWCKLIVEAISAGQQKVAAKISNWLETRSHNSHLSGALLTSGPDPRLCPQHYPSAVF